MRACRRKLGAAVFGLVCPLVTKADGTNTARPRPAPSGSTQAHPRIASTILRAGGRRRRLKLLKVLSFVARDEIEGAESQPPTIRALARAQDAGARAHHPRTWKTACDDAVRASEIMFGGSCRRERGRLPGRGGESHQEPGQGRVEGGGRHVDCSSPRALDVEGQARKDVEEAEFISTTSVTDFAAASPRAICSSGIPLCAKGTNYAVLSAAG